MKDFDRYVFLGLLLVVSVFDPLRDFYWCGDGSWWMRHVFKWLAFYPVLIYFAIKYFRWYAVLIGIGSWVVWQVSLYLFTDAYWESWWIVLLKKLFS